MTATTILAATPIGARLAAHLADALPDAHVDDRRPARHAVADAWARGDRLVLVMAVGAAVRLIAGHLDDKRTDPPLVAVDDAGRHAVCVSGAHHGGDTLAEQVADALGATAVLTTSSHAIGLPALDQLGRHTGLRLDPDIADVAAVGAALAGAQADPPAGPPVARWRDEPWPTGPLAAVVDTDTPGAPGITVSERLVDLPRPQVCYRPPSLVVGVGASCGVTADELDACVANALAAAGLSPLSVCALATVDAKAGEPGISALAKQRGWPLVTHPAETLARVDVPNPSAEVGAAVGTPSVAEAAALVTAGQGAELVVEKARTNGPTPDAAPRGTVAVARRCPRGQLLLVSTGPGDPALVPPAAREALGSAELVIGLDQYIDRVRAWLRPGTTVHATPIGQEVARARDAITSARAGRRVALLSGGDVGTYAMASPALEQLADDPHVDVAVIPGITAASAAAAVLGSPLGHDHCAISLSDLLTPWEVIRRRVKAAAEGDFVIALYNPRSRDRRWQLDEALALVAEHRDPDTPVGIVTDASRPSQRVTLTTLGTVDVDTVDMLTIVLVGSSQTVVHADRMVTRRGYR